MQYLWEDPIFFKRDFFSAKLSVKSGQELATLVNLAGSEEGGRVSAQREIGEMAARGRCR
jgi:hypothetical protein